MRIVVAIAVVGVAIAAAAALHGYQPLHNTGDCHPGGFGSAVNCVQVPKHPSWADPVAIVLVAVGIATAAAIILRR